MSDRYGELSDDIQDLFNDIVSKKAFPINIGFRFVYDSKLKQVIKIQKLSDIYNYLLDKEILVLVNEDLFDKLDEESLTILFEQEIDKIAINGESGKITMNKPDLITFAPLVNKYGADKVLRANQIDVLSSEQHEDMMTNFK